MSPKHSTENLSEVLSAQIQQAIADRETERATALIKKWIASQHLNPKLPSLSPAVFTLCEWYRRLGLFDEGFRWVAPQRELKTITSTATPQGLRTLWAARFLNQMGATEFALSLTAKLTPHDAESARILGNIFLINYEHQKASALFAQMQTFLPASHKEWPYIYRVTLLSYADSAHDWVENPKNALKKALALAQSCLDASPEPYLKAMATQAQGEYYARAGEFLLALKKLEEADPLYPAGDKTLDRAVWHKWMGYTLARLGQREKSLSEFSRALDLLGKPQYSPESRLDLLSQKIRSGVATSAEETLFLQYPGTPPGLLRSVFAEVPSQHASRTLEPSSSSAVISSVAFSPPTQAAHSVSAAQSLSSDWISLLRSEKSIDQNLSLGLGYDDRLLALVILSGDWGLPILRTINLLWPDQVASLPSLQKRLENLLVRLKKQGYVIEAQNGWLHFAGKKSTPKRLPKIENFPIEIRSQKRLGELLDTPKAPPSFLIQWQNESFTTLDVCTAYSLKRTQALSVINEWLKTGWVEAQGIKPRLTYVIVTSKL